jgi:hypothetical protein
VDEVVYDLVLNTHCLFVTSLHCYYGTNYEEEELWT